MHLENITLLEKLNQLEQQSTIKLPNSNNDSFLEERGRSIEIADHSSLNKNSSQILLNNSVNNINSQNVKLGKSSYNEYGHDNSINISLALKENSSLKEKFDKNNLLRHRLKIIKDELDRVTLKCGTINAENIILSKLYSQGVHEISLELLNVHESQIDRVSGIESLI